MQHRWGILGAVLGASFALAGCAATSRVDDALLKGGALQRAGKAIALVRVGKARPECELSTITVGQVDGDGYKRVAGAIVKYANPKEPPIAELQLDPGEYHIIGYSCHFHRTTLSLSEPAGFNRMKRSYANFKLEKGEVLNIGALTIAENPTQVSGGPISIALMVSDWPLNDLDAFKLARPKLFEQMKTRLMTRTPIPTMAPLTKEECARLAALKRDGKLQVLPTGCAAV